MRNDSFGTPTSLADADAIEAWDKAVLAFLAHGAETPKHLVRTLELAPRFALAHAVKGLFYLLLGRRELIETAREALKSADQALQEGGATPRERHFVDALRMWLDGKPTASIASLEQVLREHPADPLAMKLSHAIRFVLGDAAGMRASIERALPAYEPDHKARGYLLGCHAFALEETGEYAKAEIAGRQSLWLAPDDAWGLHAVAHVYDMTADARGGIDWLTGREAAWAHCNNFRYHVWWHKALMHLDLGEVDTVLALYDAEIRADKTDDYRDISNATSLLSRLELDGVDVGTRWEELAQISAERTEDGCLIFADLHYLLALIGGQREDAIARLLGRMQCDAAASGTESQIRMGDPGLASARGLQAFGEADFHTAFDHLAQARRTLQNAGGSHAQRDVFERLTIDAGIRAGRLDQAEAILDDRQARRAGREDGYTSARRDLIAAGRGAAHQSIPAQ
ncbi:tetratricopeptide repeat protein [Thalassococcus sp. S3]|uniref:tetratricopeptide repeat protein n=1 Tax=Thalassococcus sp. S3 TaxID=2017482 RepID=UPI0010243A33|nr:tetratricopeptide repeat protein [Thalassococcus sp. S3]QBF31898.1 tetratricopeptide repeat protein 38 family protein [Thalassococcus sp. S3]